MGETLCLPFSQLPYFQPSNSYEDQNTNLTFKLAYIEKFDSFRLFVLFLTLH